MSRLLQLHDDTVVVPTKPVEDPAGWESGKLGVPTEWQYRLTDADRAELDAALAHVRRENLSILEVTKGDFPLPNLGKHLQKVRSEILEGRGFVLLRGVPVERYSRHDA